MDRRINPYAPGAGTQPPELAGRDSILEDAEVALVRVKNGLSEQGILLTGLRGVGKTVLLNRIQRMAEVEGYQTDLLEAPEDRSLASILVPSLRQALVRLSIKEQAKDLVDRALRVLKSFSLSANLAEGEIALKYEPELGRADSGDMERDLSDLFVAVGEAAKSAKSGVALLIDEIQYLAESDLAALIVAVHRVMQRGLPVVVMGAGLPSLPALSGDAKSYAERLFRYPRIGALGAEDAKKALSEPALERNVAFDQDALDEIVRMTAGYPYFVQEWGYVIWNIAQCSPINMQDVKKASEEAIRRLDENFFRARLDRVTDAEQRYLRAMAQLGEGPYKSGDIAGLFGKRSASFGPVRDSLIKKGMIYSPRHGMIDYTVPLFDAFMRRAIPRFEI